MRIEFDTGNEQELAVVAALIAHLRGDQAAPQLPGQSDIVRPTPAPTPAVPAPPAGDEPDPAAAFGGQSPEQAFAAPNGVQAAGESSVGAGAGVASSAPTPPVPPSPPQHSVPAGVETDGEGLPWDKRIHSDPPKKNADGKWRAKRNLDDAVRAQVVAELQQVMGAPAAPLAAAGGASATPAPAAPAPTAAPSAPAPTPPAAPTASGPDAATTAPSAPPAPPAPVVAHDPMAAAQADGWAVHPQSAAHYYRGQEVVTDTDLAARYPAPAPVAPTPPPPPVPTAPAAPAAPAAGPVATFADLMRKITAMQTAGTLTVEQTTAISQELGITGVRDLMHRPDLIPTFDAKLPGAA